MARLVCVGLYGVYAGRTEAWRFVQIQLDYGPAGSTWLGRFNLGRREPDSLITVRSSSLSRAVNQTRFYT